MASHPCMVTWQLHNGTAQGVVRDLHVSMRVMSDSDTLQTPSLLSPREQHRRLCARSTISDYPSQTNLTAHRSPAPSLHSALCLNPNPTRRRGRDRGPVLPDRGGPRGLLSVQQIILSYIQRDTFTHS
ncbi:hypothetical protein JOQ06_015198 [Pogonophryne albipinna]|uniref:Uncharacterized protein n=1 Tax=Pogonophryne albipinna TaxID=1090488 RepID=A0AAD6AMJ3_9TELE|nr:hypothetical protein JOQ06_015198 [Pogonophryne albipinna]